MLRQTEKAKSPPVVAAGIAFLCVAVCNLATVARQAAAQVDGDPGDGSVQSASAPPVQVTTVEGITEFVLGNGLRVLLCPDPSRPTITVNITYLVGSRHEGRGEAGMAHLLEHMLGRGTDSFLSVREALADRGADFNADTWFDRTHFYETLSANEDNLDFVLHLEAERMARSRITPEELAQEMSIVANEFELIESDPVTILSQRMMSAAYLWHNYGRTTIGNLSDLKRYPIENLRRFYRKYYQPDNATLLVVGQLDVDRALELVNKHFGPIPRPVRVLGQTYTEEPPQDGPRSVLLRRVGAVGAVGVVYHVPAGTHPDAPAVQVLRDVLVSKPSGRLYKALVETGLAVGLRGDEGAVVLAEPGVLEVIAEVRHGQDLGQVQARMIEVIEGLAADGVSGQEVERAKGRRLKDVRRTVSDTSRLANALTEWIALGDWRTFFIHRDRLRAVSAADVDRVASQYLIETNRTAGMLVPAKEMLRATIPPVPDVGELVEGYHGTQATAAGEAFVATPENIDRRTLRVSLEPGMKVALLQKETRGDMVRAEFRFHFGDEQSLSAHVTALRLLPALLQRGTAKRDYQQLRDEIDRLQSEISVRGGVGTFAASIESDRAHIVPAIALLAEMLQQPAFAPAQFEIVKKERLARLEEDLSSSQERCFNALRRAVYPWPADSIHYMPTLEEKNERLKAVSLETVKDLYARFYGGGHSEVSVVGDFDRGAVLKALGTHFGTWESGYPYRRIEMPHRAIDTRHRTVDVPGAQMSVVAMGTHLEMRDDDPDYPALRFASYVLGESDKCRLYSRLRYKDAMTYHTGGYLRADSQDRRTSVFAYAFCSPTEADKVLQVMAEEVRRWIADGVTAEELAASQKSYRLECLNQLADDSFVARELIDGLELGRKMAFHDDVLSRIQALTEADIKRALNEHLGGAKFVEIKAGDFE